MKRTLSLWDKQRAHSCILQETFSSDVSGQLNHLLICTWNPTDYYFVIISGQIKNIIPIAFLFSIQFYLQFVADMLTPGIVHFCESICSKNKQSALHFVILTKRQWWFLHSSSECSRDTGWDQEQEQPQLWSLYVFSWNYSLKCMFVLLSCWQVCLHLVCFCSWRAMVV